MRKEGAADDWEGSSLAGMRGNALMKKMGRYLMTRTAVCWRRINEETDPPYALMDGLKRRRTEAERWDKSGQPSLCFVFYFYRRIISR